MITRREFVKDGLAALGFLALPGGLFAAPAGWKPKGKKPNLVVGILSDTHLQSGWDGVTPHDGFPLTYVTNAMKLFRERNIDAFMHLGDAAHRGKNVEIQYHRDIFEKFFPHGKAKDGHKVEKLLVVGNHELYGNVAAGAGAWAPHIWKDPVERAKHVLCGDLPKHWEQVWGEKYEVVWHKEVKGYHFFGRHWETEEMKLADFVNAKAGECSLKGTKPFFILSHERNHFAFFNALKEYTNAVAFCGHWHMSNADWKTIFLGDFGFSFFPTIQVGACRMDGANYLDSKERLAKGDLTVEQIDHSTAWSEVKNPSRQAMIVNVYDDMVVFERHEVGEGGKLGPDWVLPLGWGTGNGERGTGKHPFSRDELKKVVGEPQFGKKAKLEVSLDRINKIDKIENRGRGLRGNNPDNPVNPVKKEPALRIKIPMADGNPDSRVYAYEIVVVGDDPKAKLFKNAFFEGCNLGVGHEPNNGITEVEIPAAELPSGKKLTIAVRPVSSLGTKGKTIGTTMRV